MVKVFMMGFKQELRGKSRKAMFASIEDGIVWGNIAIIDIKVIVNDGMKFVRITAPSLAITVMELSLDLCILDDILTLCSIGKYIITINRNTIMLVIM